MVEIKQLQKGVFGRLGNSLFQYAFLYAYARKHGLDLFYQDPAWFQGYEEEIKQLFWFNQKPAKIDMVAIHVRRGDYVNNPFYCDLTETDYYHQAMALFPHQEFLVFSDDISFCRTLFSGKQFEFSEGKTEVEDLNLMASCTGHIIANSSFSWWGAYLAPHSTKVVYPKQWYSDGVERTVCPSSWIAL